MSGDFLPSAFGPWQRSWQHPSGNPGEARRLPLKGVAGEHDTLGLERGASRGDVIDMERGVGVR